MRLLKEPLVHFRRAGGRSPRTRSVGRRVRRAPAPPRPSLAAPLTGNIDKYYTAYKAITAQRELLGAKSTKSQLTARVGAASALNQA